ncbi:MAG TPA: argininosuccinate synthase [Fastidiosipila sp.]|nr:argininosuccinate synthase [Fastidiosipila sp.]
MKQYSKVVLAYSGGLDTSVLLHWLKANGVAEVICVAADLGQIKDRASLEKKAKMSGAAKLHVLDLKETFLRDYAFAALRAGAKYEGVYLLGTATARPLIAEKLVEIAHLEEASVICHGCTGKGNDQVRFELMINALDPSLEVLAPWRFWEIRSRSQEIDYAELHGIPLDVSREDDYSKDENLWHLSHEGLDLESTENEADLDRMLEWSVPPWQAESEPAYVSITFERGYPVAVDDETFDPVSLVSTLNVLGSRHAIGIDDIVENRLVGMKSRGVYENPAGTILYKAHQYLESVTLDRDTYHYKQKLALDYASLVYNGQWMSTLKQALDAFVDKTQEQVSGTVRLKLYRGNVLPAGISSPYSLYSAGYATFEEDDVYQQSDATGFIHLYGLPIRIQAKMRQRNGL